MKYNYFEVVGYLTRDVIRIKNFCITTVALYNGKDENGESKPPVYTSIAFIVKEDSKIPVKGDKVHMIGRFQNYTNKHTGYNELGLVSHTFEIINKEEANAPDWDINFETEIDLDDQLT